MAELEVPDRFQKAVFLHLFKNLHPLPPVSTPLILGIHGPSGEGKTVQCLKLFSEINASVVPISGGQLESPNAGEPAETIREGYRRAAMVRNPQNGRIRPAVLFLNDFDAAVGDWGAQVQYTVNRQTVFGELMHLADFPTKVGGKEVPRVPIVLTGNNFTRLYSPLTRLGRMTLFSWSPQQAEKIRIISEIYPQLDHDEHVQLLRKFQDQPIAFFAQLRTELEDDSLWRYLEYKGARCVFKELEEGLVPDPRESVFLDKLLEAGNRLLKARILSDHLQGA
jgi:SpoVK/Ycf46/Vps4 family AAA+-type ATPase